jgi:hypothetical protein
VFEEAFPLAEKAFGLAPMDAPSVGIYAGLLVRLGPCCGEIDLAADWYEKAIEERDSLVTSTVNSAIGEPLRSRPRWPKLAALMNLPAIG